MTKPSSSVTLTHHEIKIFKIISKSFILPQLVMKYENISVKTQFLFPAISTTKSPIICIRTAISSDTKIDRKYIFSLMLF